MNKVIEAISTAEELPGNALFEIAEYFGLDMAKDMLDKFGGTQLNIPTVKPETAKAYVKDFLLENREEPKYLILRRLAQNTGFNEMTLRKLIYRMIEEEYIEDIAIINIFSKRETAKARKKKESHN